MLWIKKRSKMEEKQDKDTIANVKRKMKEKNCQSSLPPCLEASVIRDRHRVSVLRTKDSNI